MKSYRLRQTQGKGCCCFSLGLGGGGVREKGREEQKKIIIGHFIEVFMRSIEKLLIF